MLCKLWDPIMFTSMEYINLNQLSQRLCLVNCVYNSGVHKLNPLSRKMRYAYCVIIS